MSTLVERINREIEAASPATWRSLSPLGRRLAFPPDIPFQAAEARNAEVNGTIGQVTDGAGGAVPTAGLFAALSGLDAPARNRALLYSPVEGVAELRERWRSRQRRDVDDGLSSSTPLVTVGLTHGLSIAGDLFSGVGTRVAAAAPFWGNYRQIFATRTGATMVTAPGFRDGRFNPGFVAEALADAPAGEPAVAILNFPSNPGGYSPTAEERSLLRASLVEVADERPLVVICDDAYAGMVYVDAIPVRSMFWELVGIHEQLLAVKVDGATKELSFFGGRVGFLTLPFDDGSEIALAFESKVKCLVRATVGSPVATSQSILLETLRRDDVDEEVERVREILGERYRILSAALATTDPGLFRPLPFNSGCFSLVELSDSLGATPDEVRRHLLDKHSTGLIAVAPNFMRIAFCSVAADHLEELVQRLEVGVAEVAGR